MLSEKNIPFEVVEIDLKNKPDWFLKLSPYGKVPVLEHGGKVFYESSVINEYLEDAFPEKAMLPTDPGERARGRFWIDFCNKKIQPNVAGILKAQPEALQGKISELEDALDRLEAHLAENEGPAPFFFGETFSLVDATFYPSFERFSVLPDLRGYTVPQRYTRIQRWKTHMASHPSVVSQSIPLPVLMANYKDFVPEQARNIA